VILEHFPYQKPHRLPPSDLALARLQSIHPYVDHLGEIAPEYEASESVAYDKYKGEMILMAGVRCNFRDDEDPVMAMLSKGQTVAIKCQGDRLLFGLELLDCRVE